MRDHSNFFPGEDDHLMYKSAEAILQEELVSLKRKLLKSTLDKDKTSANHASKVPSYKFYEQLNQVARPFRDRGDVMQLE